MAFSELEREYNSFLKKRPNRINSEVCFEDKLLATKAECKAAEENCHE